MWRLGLRPVRCENANLYSYECVWRGKFGHKGRVEARWLAYGFALCPMESIPALYIRFACENREIFATFHLLNKTGYTFAFGLGIILYIFCCGSEFYLKYRNSSLHHADYLCDPSYTNEFGSFGKKLSMVP